ncbi:T9SS type A sorting domain-containing protein [Flavobacterium sp.]|uniref:T9SS type A sorting domain-containing protein n=1 Tax=Flavobacterium sp. TaxID=239 RepID=UPI00286D2222|nr:T9SS type A sorting domain-containing protein [Flavobacterium sp.]
MKTAIFLLLCLLSLQKISALNIVQVSVSNVSEKLINVSLNTEAVELYYFDSWQYSISENTITIEALFIPGFGSNIAYLNNNFQLPINTTQTEIYHLVVKAYYTFYKSENLQDMIEGAFSTPFSGIVVLSDSTLASADFVNPINGELLIDTKIRCVWIFDINGKYIGNFKNRNGKITLQNYEDGIYLVGYFKQQRYTTMKIILKKQ